MRIPLTIVIPSALVVTATAWWLGTRHKDFMRAPDAATLERIRTETIAHYPDPDQGSDALSAPGNDRDNTTPTPKLTLEELSRDPAIDEYSERGRYGVKYLSELAALLEQAGHPQRARLAWERILDSTKANDHQIQQARNAIAALRGNHPDTADLTKDPRIIVIHAGTGQSTAERIRPTLDDIARQLENSTNGTIRIRVEIATGSDDSNQNAPVAIWLAGAATDSPSSDILAFSATAEANVPDEVGRALHELIRSLLNRNNTLKTPPALGTDDNPLDALQNGITRLAWKHLSETLNPTP